MIFRTFVPHFNEFDSAKQQIKVSKAQHIVRKLAHFSIYASLGFFISLAFGKRKFLSRMTLEAGPEEGSYYINNTYNTDGESTHPGYIKANVEDGSLTIATEKDEYCVWKFLTEEEFDALATRISSVEKQPATQAIFNIAGQQIKALQKGLNIVNGKKIMVK